jgi:hypothetical protein
MPVFLCYKFWEPIPQATMQLTVLIVKCRRSFPLLSGNSAKDCNMNFPSPVSYFPHAEFTAIEDVRNEYNG